MTVKMSHSCENSQ